MPFPNQSILISTWPIGLCTGPIVATAPRGNTVNRAAMDVTPGARKDPEIIFNHLMEGIGLALDLKNNRLFMTDLAGSVYSCDLDGIE